MRMKTPEMRKARIEIIPMIDTIFFLLVFFMVTWLTMVKMNGLRMNLPRRTQASSGPHYSVTLSLSPAGTYYLDARPAAPDAWEGRLRERLEAHPDAVVVVNVAATQNTQTLISLLDSVNHVIAASHSRAQVLVATPRAGTPEKEPSYAKR